MAKHVVFFVHGMGNHDNKWHEAGLKALSSAWSEYDNLNDDTLEDKIEAISVVYNDIFEVWRQRMKSDFDSFKGALLGTASNIANEDQGQVDAISKKLDRIGEWIGAGEPEFVWTHAMDVVLYRFFTQIRMAIDVSVLKQILERVNKGNFKTWSVVGHSLGTSVVHNSINSLYGAGVGDVAPLSPNETRARVIMMVANVSRILERPGAKVFESRVRPGASNTGRTCGYYLNVRHKLDPFTYPRPFERDPWPDATTFMTDRYQHIRPGHVQFNKTELMKVHDFEHYLKNPRVHVPLLRAILGNVLISDDEFRDAKAGFDADQLDSAIDQVRSALESKLPAPGSNWGVFVELFKKLK